MTEQTQSANEQPTNAEPQIATDSLLSGLTEVSPNSKNGGVPEEFWDKEKNSPAIEKLLDAWKNEKNRAEGLRKKLSKGEFETVAPEDVKEYAVDLGEEGKDLALEGDPVWEAARVAAKEAGLSKDAFAKFMTPVLKEMQKIAQENQSTEESIAEYKAQELEKLGPSGLRIAQNVKAFVGELNAKGILTSEDVVAVQNMITNADALRAFNRIRSAMTNTQDVPLPNETMANASFSKAELEAELVKASNAKDETKYNAIRQKLFKIAST